MSAFFVCKYFCHRELTSTMSKKVMKRAIPAVIHCVVFIISKSDIPSKSLGLFLYKWLAIKPEKHIITANTAKLINHTNTLFRPDIKIIILFGFATIVLLPFQDEFFCFNYTFLTAYRQYGTMLSTKIISGVENYEQNSSHHRRIIWFRQGICKNFCKAGV